jgi:hypothetical protein
MKELFAAYNQVNEGSEIALQSVLVMECSKTFYMESNFTLWVSINSFANHTT